MLAVVVHEPGGPEVLTLEEWPTPEPAPGWVLVRVRALGLNRAELITRAGGSERVRFPRVLGLECAGEVVQAPGTELRPGERVIATMGGMGMEFDGGYAQFALVPASSTFPVRTPLEWRSLAAIPASFGTAWGALDALGLERRQSLLVRGGSSSVGMAAIALAAERRIEVFATTRQERKRAALEAAGADHVIIDDGRAADAVRHLAPEGVDGLLELVGPTACADSLRALGSDGRACIAGSLEGNWDVGPAQAEATRLRIPLSRFDSDVINLQSYRHVFGKIVRSLEQGRIAATVDRTFALSEIADAHRHMEANGAAGKVVVLTPEGF